ncbi:MAG: hypothetical protein K1X79_12830 [Oligoflexia bacterium]|nr:hypothetical protein [Oligoflexia bacterium]
MVTQIRHWIAVRELLALANKASLVDFDPDAVVRMLHSFARSSSGSNKGSTHLTSSQLTQAREAVIRIWELSRQQYMSDNSRRARWHLAMASCSCMYEQLHEIIDLKLRDQALARKAA